MGVRDPQNSLAAGARVDGPARFTKGPYAARGPDLVVGYNRSYGAGWRTILGNFPTDILEQHEPVERRLLHGFRAPPACC